MPEKTRVENHPSLTAREHWGGYAAGLLIETAFILVLAAVGLILAAVAAVIWL